MNYFFLVSGIILILIVLYDLTFTIFSLTGAGILTGRITHFIWRFFLYMSNYNGNNKTLNFAGMATIYSILLVWILLIWAGNSLVICSDNYSVLHLENNMPASTVEKIYYTGYTLSTLGNGDFKPGTSFWRIYTVIISFSGLIFISSAITYLIPVLSSEISKRQLSLYIATMGNSPEEILINGWDGKNFNTLNRHFMELNQMIMKHGQNHLAYPILYYFHSCDKKDSANLALVTLDEALSILLIRIPEEIRPSLIELNIIRKAITTYLETLSAAYIAPVNAMPPAVVSDRLQASGIPLIKNEDEIKQHYDKIAKRRCLLAALLKNDGWSWQDIRRDKFNTDLDFV